MKNVVLLIPSVKETEGGDVSRHGRGSRKTGFY
jgi:hypothetical protein